MSTPTSNPTQPAKGQRYRHKGLRGVWTVRSAGPKFVTLKSNIPWLPARRIPTDGFLSAEWELLSGGTKEGERE